MIDRIDDNPNDISAYTAFLSYFHDPSIISAMQMLASMANAGNNQAAYQLTQLVDSAFLMQHEADILTNKKHYGSYEESTGHPGCSRFTQIIS